MPKPLLPDEVIAEAKKGDNWDKHVEVSAEVPKPLIKKSRTREHARRGGFQSTLNRLLVLVFLLLLALLYAMFRL